MRFLIRDRSVISVACCIVKRRSCSVSASGCRTLGDSRSVTAAQDFGIDFVRLALCFGDGLGACPRASFLPGASRIQYSTNRLLHPGQHSESFRTSSHRVSVAGSHTASAGPNGSYLFELEPQPGEPEWRPTKGTGSQPIAISGRPRDDRPAHTIAFSRTTIFISPLARLP